MPTMDNLNALRDALAQIHAGLQLTYGMGGATFREFSASTQDNHLWMLSERVEFCRSLLEENSN